MSTGQNYGRRLGWRAEPHSVGCYNHLPLPRTAKRRLRAWSEILSARTDVARDEVHRTPLVRPQELDPARVIRGAAAGIMFIALLLAAVSVHAAPLPVQVPAGIALSQPNGPMLFVRGQDGRLTMLLPEETRVTARANALWAHVTVQHRFRAGSMSARSGLYVLPLPAGAKPRRLELAVGDRRVEIGLAVEDQDAQPDIAALPIAGIPANSEVLVRFTYDRPVELGEGRFVLSLPVSHSKPTQGASTVAWQRANVTLSVDLDPGLPIAELYSPSHGIDISRQQDERRRIVLANSEAAEGRDFILIWKPTDPHASIGALRRYTALKTPALPRAEDALVLHTRPIGPLLALTPASLQPALLVGSPIDNSAILNQIDAPKGAAQSVLGSPATPAIAGAALLIWAIGAFYFATRRAAEGTSSNNSIRETTQ